MSIDNCTLCGKCLVCPYLAKYGYPREIYLKKDSSVFCCTNCGLCNILCPFDATPAEALYRTKEWLIEENNLHDRIEQVIRSSRKFVVRMSSFPFSHLDAKEVLFFPGCSVVSRGKDMVLRLKGWIEKKMGQKVGLVLHCCGDPAYQNGDTGFVRNFVQTVREKLENNGTNKIILSCSNCKKVFKEYFKGVELFHIAELIDENDVRGMADFGILHHPCPNFKNEEVKNKIEALFGKKTELILNLPMCCGLGGAVSKLDKDVSDAFLKRTAHISEDKNLLTSCMGCKNRFLKYVVDAKHIYEVITGLDIREPLSEVRKWINRLFVSIKAKINPLKLLVFFVLAFAILFVHELKKEGVLNFESILNWLKSAKFISPLLYVLFYSIAPSVFFPSLLLTIIAGVIWGPFWGVVFAITGATIGCSVPFLLSRYIFYDTVKKSFGIKRWEKLSNLVKKDGWKVVLFTRLVPIFPFPVLNYLFGITPVSFSHYVSTSLLGMLPACIAYVYFGSSIFELIKGGNILPLILAVVVVSVITVIPHFLKKMFYNK